ncbi:MAG: hypothetical protein SO176_02195 [Bacilli bacterium]|nr:hypothetical protein [Bacilli bacterium]
MEKNLKINKSHIIILYTIKLLNNLGYYPNENGVYKIVNGILDNETEPFKQIETFSTLVSFSSKKICRYVLALSRYGYINKIYSKPINELLLSLSEKGEDELFNVLNHKKIHFIKHEKKVKRTIFKF